MSDSVIYLPPSSVGFLFEECRSCFYMEIHRLKKRPRMPFPTIFNTIDAQMKQTFAKAGWHDFGNGMQQYRLASAGKWVQSMPIAVPGTAIRLSIRGAYDSILVGTDSSRALVDFKTSAVHPTLVLKYQRQLQAYAHALENPMSAPALKIDRLGLLVFEPARFALCGREGSLAGNLRWLEVRRDDAAFGTFLSDVGHLLAGPVPLPSPNCPFCTYRYGNAA